MSHEFTDRQPLSQSDQKPFTESDRQPLSDSDRKPFAESDRQPLSDSECFGAIRSIGSIRSRAASRPSSGGASLTPAVIRF
jgi:hypothetical protein